MNAFTLKESTFMRGIGIYDREVMRSVRHAVLGESGWVNRPGHGVFLSQTSAERIEQSLTDHVSAGIAKIGTVQKNAPSKNGSETILTFQSCPDMPLSEKTPLRPAAPASSVLCASIPSEKTRPVPLPSLAARLDIKIATVRRRNSHFNKNILEAVLGTGSVIHIRVRSYRNFLPGSPTGAVLVRLVGDHWYFAGKPDSVYTERGGWNFSIPHSIPETPHMPRFPGRW